MRNTAASLKLNMPKTRGRPKLRSDDELAEIIVGKAFELFLDVGFAQMRMDDVATRCRVSKRTLYRLFPSKLELFRSLANRHRQSMLSFPVMADRMALEVALAEVFRLDIDPEEDCRRMAFIRHTLLEAEAEPELRDILHEESGEKGKALLAIWLSGWKVSGAAGLGDPYAAASILMDMVFGAYVLKPSDPNYRPGDADRKLYLRECFRYFVNGVK
jgi:AcrR family transcriptional regulator